MPPAPTDEPQSPSMRQTLTLPEFAAMVGASRSFIYELAQAGRLPVPLIRIGSRLRVSRHAVEQLLGPEGGDRRSDAPHQQVD